MKNISNKAQKALAAIILLAVSVFLGLRTEDSEQNSVELEKVVDGDTLHVKLNNKSVKVRLSYIDAPELTDGDSDIEKNQMYFATLAKDELERLLQGKNLELFIQGEDQYGRVLGEIFADQENINQRLLKEGFVALYYKHPKDYESYERSAKKLKKGIWDTKNPLLIEPYKFRKSTQSLLHPYGCFFYLILS